jgi:hypothetical protein
MDPNAGAKAGGDRNAASDEELARRLHEQLNGEALATALRRRTRKQPSFYTPQVQAHEEPARVLDVCAV